MAEKYGKKTRELMVKEIQKVLDPDKGFVFSSFEKVSSSTMDSFRKKINGAGSKHMIVQKRLGKLALHSAGVTDLDDVFEKQENVSVTIIDEDPVAIAKILVDFSKKEKKFKVSGGYLEGRSFDADKVKELASLPSRQQLLGMVVSTMNAPISGFVGTLASVLRSFPLAINAIKEKKRKNK